MKLLAGSFAATMGDVPDNHDVVSGLLPPLAPADGVLDLEFSLLLAFDAIVFDRYSLQRLESYRDPGTRRVAESLRVLESEGLVVLEDMRGRVTSDRSFIDRAATTALRDASLWLPHLKHEIVAYDRLLPGLQASFGSVLSDWDQQTYGIASHLLASTGGVEQSLAHELRCLIEGTNQRRRRAEDNETLRGVLLPLVQNVYANLYLSEIYDSIPYGWGTLSGFYDQALVLAVRRVDDEAAKMEQCRRFFDVAFREFKPRSVRAWVRLLQDQRVKDLRAKSDHTTLEQKR